MLDFNYGKAPDKWFNYGSLSQYCYFSVYTKDVKPELIDGETRIQPQNN